MYNWINSKNLINLSRDFNIQMRVLSGIMWNTGRALSVYSGEETSCNSRLFKDLATNSKHGLHKARLFVKRLDWIPGKALLSPWVSFVDDMHHFSAPHCPSHFPAPLWCLPANYLHFYWVFSAVSELKVVQIIIDCRVCGANSLSDDLYMCTTHIYTSVPLQHTLWIYQHPKWCTTLW